jgi:hypothetical protein
VTWANIAVQRRTRPGPSSSCRLLNGNGNLCSEHARPAPAVGRPTGGDNDGGGMTGSIGGARWTQCQVRGGEAIKVAVVTMFDHRRRWWASSGGQWRQRAESEGTAGRPDG